MVTLDFPLQTGFVADMAGFSVALSFSTNLTNAVASSANSPRAGEA